MPENQSPRNLPSAPLSTGDGIAIVALLVFICIWVAGWALLPQLQVDTVKENGGALILMLIIIAGPPLWAGSRIHKIISRH